MMTTNYPVTNRDVLLGMPSTPDPDTRANLLLSLINSAQSLMLNQLEYTASGVSCAFSYSISGANWLYVLTPGMVDRDRILEWRLSYSDNSIYPFGKVKFLNGKFIALGNASLVYLSSDGYIWSVSDTSAPDKLNDIIFDGSQYIAVGDSGTIVTSLDLSEWVVASVDTVIDVGEWPDNNFYSIIFNNSTYVIVGQDIILSSPDCVNWTRKNQQANFYSLDKIIFDSSLYIAVGVNGTILTSDDLENWTSQDSGTNNRLRSIAKGNGDYIAVGYNSTILTSSDAINWSQQVSSIQLPSVRFHDVIYGNGVYVVVGDNSSPNTGICAVSEDGVDWSMVSTFDSSISSVALNDTLYIAVGSSIYNAQFTGLRCCSSPEGCVKVNFTASVLFTSGGPIIGKINETCSLPNDGKDYLIFLRGLILTYSREYDFASVEAIAIPQLSFERSHYLCLDVIDPDDTTTVTPDADGALIKTTWGISDASNETSSFSDTSLFMIYQSGYGAKRLDPNSVNLNGLSLPAKTKVTGALEFAYFLGMQNSQGSLEDKPVRSWNRIREVSSDVGGGVISGFEWATAEEAALQAISNKAVSPSSLVNYVRRGEIDAIWEFLSYLTTVTLVSGVSLGVSSFSVYPGSTYQLTASIIPASAVNTGFTWQSSNSARATVSNQGLVTGVSPGTAEIQVVTNNGGFIATATVTVLKIDVTGVILDITSRSLSVNSLVQLTPTVSPSNATYKTVSWTTSNSAVATVNTNGLVTAIAAGSATITCTTDDIGKTDRCYITVVIPVTGLTISPTSASKEVGQSLTITATVSPSNATNQAVTWTTSNSAVATVSGGTVTTKSAGSATITCTTSDGSYQKTCALTVTNPVVSGDIVSIVVSPAHVSLTPGQKQNFIAEIAISGTVTNSSLQWSVTDGKFSVKDNLTLAYTAPISNLGTFTVTATSVAYPNVFGTATVTVTI